MQVRIPQLFEEIAANKPRGCQSKRHNCYAGDNNTRIIEHQSVVLALLLCATSVFSVSLWLTNRSNNSPQRHREHRDCTEKSIFEAQEAAGFIVGELIELEQEAGGVVGGGFLVFFWHCRHYCGL